MPRRTHFEGFGVNGDVGRTTALALHDFYTLDLRTAKNKLLLR